jgi:glycosyltransferase involved in cell wall biosynthesis
MCDDSYDMVKNHRDFTIVHRLARKIIVPFLDNILLVDKRTVDWYQEKYKKGIWLPIIRDERKEIKINGMIQPLTESIKLKYKLLNKRILLYVGRLVEVKNLHTLIDAIELTKSSFTTIIVGSGHLDKELKEYAQPKSKEIIFIGQQNSNEVRTWFQIADAFILPSTLEPYGAVTNEALIAGCYSIISIQAGSACLINETNGCHINPHSSFDISRKIDSFFTSYDKSKNINKENKMLFSFDSIITTVIQQIYA